MPNTNTDTTVIEDNALVVDHPRVRLVEREIFILRFVTDCMQHGCLCRDEKDLARADACCQHGADVLRGEKSAILRRASEISSVLKPEWKKPETWFDERDPEVISEEPFVDVVRTGTTDLDVENSGCIFLNHEGDRRRMWAARRRPQARLRPGGDQAVRLSPLSSEPRRGATGAQPGLRPLLLRQLRHQQHLRGPARRPWGDVWRRPGRHPGRPEHPISGAPVEKPPLT